MLIVCMHSCGFMTLHQCPVPMYLLGILELSCALIPAYQVQRIRLL